MLTMTLLTLRTLLMLLILLTLLTMAVTAVQKSLALRRVNQVNLEMLWSVPLRPRVEVKIAGLRPLILAWTPPLIVKHKVSCR